MGNPLSIMSVVAVSTILAGHLGSAAAEGGLYLSSWTFGSDRNALDGTESPNASAEDELVGGGTVIVGATCNDKSMDFDFEYHAKTDAGSQFERLGNATTVHIRYRLDNGGVQEANVRSEYRNKATITFGFLLRELNQAKPSDRPGPTYPQLVSKEYNKALYASFLPQDLRRLLHARSVRFELPIAGRKAGTVQFDPQNAVLRRLVRACKIDLASADTEAAKDDAVSRTTAKSEADRQAAARNLAAAKERADADQVASVRRACVTGGVIVRATDRGTFADADHKNIMMVPVQKGELLRTDATNPDAVANGVCHVVGMLNGVEYRGPFSTGMLAVDQHD